MKIFKLLSITLAIAWGISSCSDDNSTIGSSIVDTNLQIVVDTTFRSMVTVESIPNDSVVGRTTNQLIGNIFIPKYGRLKTDFLTQFMPAATLDTASVARLDSLVLYLSYNADSFTGDSLAPMQLSVYPLTKQLSSPVYSSINPEEYYDKQAAPIAVKSYNASYLGLPDSLVELGYKMIPVRLPDTIANHIYKTYKENPSIFSSPSRFAENVFSGLYIKTSYGSGCVVNVQNALMNLHYTKQTKTDAGADSLYAATQSVMAVTSEITTGNHITLELDTVGRNGKIYLQAPAGLNVQVNLPIRQMVEKFENETSANSSVQALINSLVLTVPVEPIANTYGIEPPSFLLFVRKSELNNFFEKKRLNDNVNTFYAQYDSDNKLYSFSISPYINEIIAKKRAGTEITDADEEIVLVPVSIYTETVSSGSSYYYYSYSEEEVVTDIVPYIEAPAMGVVDTKNIQLQLTYSKQSKVE